MTFISESLIKKHKGEAENEFDITDIPDFTLSLCGKLEKIKKVQDKVKMFMAKQISYETYNQNPQKYLEEKDLRIKFGSSVFTWVALAPQLLCNLAFKQPLDLERQSELNDEQSSLFGISKTKQRIDFEE